VVSKERAGGGLSTWEDPLADYMDSKGCLDLEGDKELDNGMDSVGKEDSNSRMDSDGRTADGRLDSDEAIR
jgi:hypothetical protein